MDEFAYLKQYNRLQFTRKEQIIRRFKLMNWRKIAVILFVVLLVLAVLYVIFKTPILQIKSVEVSGLNNSELVNIDKNAAFVIVSESIGESYFTVNAQTVIEKLSAQFPFVKNVVVSKEFPDKLLFQIEERQPVFTVNINNTQCVLLEADGFVIDVELDPSKCRDESAAFKTVYIETVNPLNPFVRREHSNVYMITRLSELKLLLASKNYSVARIVIKDEYCEITLQNQKILVFAIDNSLQVQVARFEIILPELEKAFDKFKVLDLRYERPVKR